MQDRHRLLGGGLTRDGELRNLDLKHDGVAFSNVPAATSRHYSRPG
jgi:hypothetical protein